MPCVVERGHFKKKSCEAHFVGKSRRKWLKNKQFQEIFQLGILWKESRIERKLHEWGKAQSNSFSKSYENASKSVVTAPAIQPHEAEYSFRIQTSTCVDKNEQKTHQMRLAGV